MAGNYDWSSVKAVQDAATECKITPIWDLCHYGFPDGCDPFSEECLERFADYCRAAAKFVTSSAEGPYFFTPINEITFFSAAASDLDGCTRSQRAANASSSAPWPEWTLRA